MKKQFSEEQIVVILRAGESGGKTVEQLCREHVVSQPTYYVTEWEMKRIVLGRKNSLFVGNERGGRTAAVLAGLLNTCRRHGIDPQRYLTQLLTNLPGVPMSRLEQRLPDQWKQANDAPMPAADL